MVGPAAALATSLLVACGLEVVGTAPVTEVPPDAAPVSLPEAAPFEPAPTDASTVDVTVPVPCEDGGTCSEAGAPVTLTVTVDGSATPGIVTASTPAISCPGTCSGVVPAGTKVKLTADPPVDQVLTGWSVAACGREPTCEVTVNGPLAVTARFGTARIYVHDQSKVYRVDPTTGAPNAGVDLSNCGISGYFDVAVDRNNAVVFASKASIFGLNPVNGQCSNAVTISNDGDCNGLAFMPDPNDRSKEVLFAACGGSLFRLNRSTGQRTNVGAFGGGYSVSGDIAWLPGKGLYGTFTTGSGDDVLARIDPLTGTIDGAVGLGTDKVSGLARRGKKLLGFGNQKILEVDPDTGTVTDLASTTFQAAGAASGP